MKAFQFVIVCLFAASSFAAPFMTPDMVKRNGLTDEQYEFLWKQGKTPQIEIAAARDWIFRASRYQNVVEWLEELGATNDFAKLAHRLQGENFDLSATNATLKTEVSSLGLRIRSLEIDVSVWQDYYNEATNYAAKVEANLDIATKRAEMAEKEAERLVALRAYLIEKRDKAKLTTTKELYQSLIDKIDAEGNQ